MLDTETMKERYIEEIVALRRYLHQHPELSLEEFKTTQFIMKELDKLGIPYIKAKPTGLIATIKGKHPGK
ncbi:MAG TPA: amidohydrolase, partial [Proteiniclasticum sp.]|nr:amidohydrolase [Proteiniclasticum sp.]